MYSGLLKHSRKDQILGWLFIVFVFCNCSKSSAPAPAPPVTPVADFELKTWTINNVTSSGFLYGVNSNATVKLNFSAPINRTSVTNSITFKDAGGSDINFTTGYSNGDSTIILTAAALKNLAKYKISVSTQLKSVAGGSLHTASEINFLSYDSTDKFPRISDSALLDLVQQHTFKYFRDFAHPVSGLARERNTSGDIVTSGGSGFGIMAIVTAVSRNFISRADGLAQMQKITAFLKDKAQKFHGAFPHWMNGTTGAVVPFSTKDDGADLVETSYLMQGLLTSRQFFNGGDPNETTLRRDIDSLWHGVQWNWFRKNNEDVLYWHWSPNYNWDMNFPIHGWNEALITYVLAASSTDYGIPKSVYDNGWALNGSIKNGKKFYNIPLPLGPDYGGPLFFAHYSFLGINPKNLTDAYANYWTQNQNHSLINYNYCVNDPKGFYGYSDSCWGLTASDDISGYSAHSPTNDDGVITPSAALSSFPYTPVESMKALKFFYYKLGDKIWTDQGFIDAFSIQDTWFASSYLAIDQGPIIAMIENYRSGLLWNLFMSCPEVKTGMHNLGFQSPNL